jgi:dTDP-glucose pyrophosphorylase
MVAMKLDKELFAVPRDSIQTALKKLDVTALKLLLIVDPENRLLGVLSDGDIRRAILAGAAIDKPIEGVFNTHPMVFEKGSYTIEGAKSLFLSEKLELVPIIDDDRKVVDAICWDDLFSEARGRMYSGPPLGVPVVIMAGGRGSRLAPFTNVLPKPLIPIGEKTILELIIDEFLIYRVDRFFLTLNYRGEMIRAYFEGVERKYELGYVREDDFYGTAGALRLMADSIDDTFFVSNCDILVKANYADVLAFHRRSGASLTVISSIQHHTIPYGVIEFQAGGEIVSIKEKPEFSFPINTGVYILEKECLSLIPPGRVFHMTHLIEALLATGKKAVTYPVNELEYIDIGQWEEYQKAINLLH